MGLYAIDCPGCKKPFMWFSGNINQYCSDCYPVFNVQLNKYQRDNLLWALSMIRKHVGELNTGDWVGEIGYLLSESCELGPEHRPNCTEEEFLARRGNK